MDEIHKMKNILCMTETHKMDIYHDMKIDDENHNAKTDNHNEKKMDDVTHNVSHNVNHNVMTGDHNEKKKKDDDSRHNARSEKEVENDVMNNYDEEKASIWTYWDTVQEKQIFFFFFSNLVS